MNGFDRDILHGVNQLAQRWYALDVVVSTLATSNAVKGGLLSVVLIALWFGRDADRERRRAILIATALASAVAIVAGRLLALALPFRIRPVHNPALGFVVPFGYPEGLLRGWSAFPSDHAMLFAAMATGLWLVSRRVGAIAAVWTTLVILAPRVYLGMHHPTDVLAGAALGAGLALAANVPPVRARLTRLPLRWCRTRPRAFYAVGFVLAMQVATMFDGPRTAAQELLAALRGPGCEAAERGGEREACVVSPDQRAVDRAIPRSTAPMR